MDSNRYVLKNNVTYPIYGYTWCFQIKNNEVNRWCEMKTSMKLYFSSWIEQTSYAYFPSEKEITDYQIPSRTYDGWKITFYGLHHPDPWCWFPPWNCLTKTKAWNISIHQQLSHQWSVVVVIDVSSRSCFNGELKKIQFLRWSASSWISLNHLWQKNQQIHVD